MAGGSTGRLDRSGVPTGGGGGPLDHRPPVGATSSDLDPHTAAAHLAEAVQRSTALAVAAESNLAGGRLMRFAMCQNIVFNIVYTLLNHSFQE